MSSLNTLGLFPDPALLFGLLRTLVGLDDGRLGDTRRRCARVTGV